MDDDDALVGADGAGDGVDDDEDKAGDVDDDVLISVSGRKMPEESINSRKLSLLSQDGQRKLSPI